MKSIVKQIERYYVSEIYRRHFRYGEDVEIKADNEITSAPCANGFLALLCAARDLSYNGKVKIIYKGCGSCGTEEYSVYTFENGTPVNVECNCPYFIYGEYQIVRQINRNGVVE